MKKFTILFLLSLVISAAYGQSFTRHNPDSLLRLLNKSRADTSRINLLLLLARFQIFKPGEFKKDMDSAQEYINSAKRINASLKSVKFSGFTALIESYLARETGQKAIGKERAEQAIALVKQGKDSSYLDEAYFELSEYYDYSDPAQIQEKIRLVELAVQQFQRSPNIERRAYVLTFLADLYQVQNENAKALHTLDLALHTYQSINYPGVQRVYVLYGNVYYNLDNWHQALRYELMALKTAENTGDTSMSLCEINNQIGALYYNLDEREKAISYFKDALKIAEKYNENSEVLELMLNIVQIYIRLNKFEEALSFLNSIPKKFSIAASTQDYINTPLCYFSVYFNLKRYNEAAAYSKKVIEIIKLNKTPYRVVANSYVWLVRFYIATKQYTSAEAYITKADSISKKEGGLFTHDRGFQLRFQLDSAKGNFRSAVYNLLNYNKYHDSLFNETKSKQIKQLEVENDTRKKEDSLKIKDRSITVLKQDIQIQRSVLAGAHLVRNVTFVGIALLFVIIGLLYRQYRIKQQSTRVIKYKNEMLEHLLKEVHHRVKNNLHTVICLLESQAAYLENDALKAIETSQHRIYAMSLIHQKLYQSEEVKAIDMSVYIPEFTEYLKDSFGVSDQVKFQLEIEPLQLNISQAIPIALIINEAVTNSIKYAFPDKKRGIIKIKMVQINKQIQLTIADNGIGIDAAIANTSLTTSLGLELMKGLSEDINARIQFENDHGTKITVTFNVDEFNKITPLHAVKEQRVYA